MQVHECSWYSASDCNSCPRHNRGHYENKIVDNISAYATMHSHYNYLPTPTSIPSMSGRFEPSRPLESLYNHSTPAMMLEVELELQSPQEELWRELWLKVVRW